MSIGGNDRCVSAIQSLASIGEIRGSGSGTLVASAAAARASASAGAAGFVSQIASTMQLSASQISPAHEAGAGFPGVRAEDGSGSQVETATANGSSTVSNATAARAGTATATRQRL